MLNKPLPCKIGVEDEDSPLSHPEKKSSVFIKGVNVKESRPFPRGS